MKPIARVRFDALALLWYFWFVGFCDQHFTVRASQGWKLCEEIEDGLLDGRHAELWRRSCDSFFPSRRFEAAGGQPSLPISITLHDNLLRSWVISRLF